MRAKLLKFSIPVVLVVLVAFGWLSTIATATSSVLTRVQTMDAAAQSYADGLYQQSILQYKDALGLGVGVEAYERIHEVYEAYYKEEHNDGVYAGYLNDMTAAYTAYPSYIEFWEQAYDLYMEKSDFKGVYLLAQEAMGAKVSLEPLMATYAELSRQTSVISDAYAEVLPASNGLSWADTGEGSVIINQVGDVVFGGYEVFGMPNAEGSYLYVGEYGTRLHDAAGVDRARYDDLHITAAGMLDPATDLVPVCVKGGKWRYLVAHSGTLLDDTYDEAGAYVAGCAAVREGEQWYVIDPSGVRLAGPFDDIKVFPGDGTWLQGGMAMFAKKGGSYALYDTNFAQVGTFTAQDIDLAHDGPVAFESGGRWGFVDLSGNVVVEPTYKGAKSFSCGNAAVCEQGSYRWGFVNGAFEPLVNADYFECEFFTTPANALVKTAEGSYAFIGFTYAES